MITDLIAGSRDPSTIHLLLTVNVFSSLFMVGLIWFVQVVHYPLMAKVPPEAYPEYQHAHEDRTALLVVPVMLVELAAGVLLVFATAAYSVAHFGHGAVLFNLALVAAIWGSTFLLQVPCHNRLSRGFDPIVHRRLVVTNWIRTALWSMKALLAIVLFRD
jgi:uncharacterized membrane protein